MGNQRSASVAVLAVILLLAGMVLGFLLPRWAGLALGQGPKMLSTPAVVQQVQTLSQLVTVKYVIEKVVVLDDVKWISGLGENRVLMIAHGIVKAGIDLAQLQP